MNIWVDGNMNIRVDRDIYILVYGHMNIWIDEHGNICVDGHMNIRVDGHGRFVRRTQDIWGRDGHRAIE